MVWTFPAVQAAGLLVVWDIMGAGEAHWEGVGETWNTGKQGSD